MLTDVPLCGLLVEQGLWGWRRRQQTQVKRPQVSADDLRNYRTLFSRERLAKMDTNLKLSRKLPELDQYSNLLPQQKLQTLEMKVLRPRPVINCIRKRGSRVSANGIAILRKVKDDKGYAYAQGLLCLCALASLASISAYACVPEALHVHTSHMFR
jgi:hypothetical protein